MTLFRFKGNGLLYTIERVSPRQMTGSWHEAMPYRHNVNIGVRNGQRFKANMTLNDFVEVAHT
jgi:hypothetical protein